MDLGVPPIESKNPLESNPLKARLSFRGWTAAPPPAGSTEHLYQAAEPGVRKADARLETTRQEFKGPPFPRRSTSKATNLGADRRAKQKPYRGKWRERIFVDFDLWGHGGYADAIV